MKMSFNITLRMLQRQRRHITRFDTAVAAREGEGWRPPAASPISGKARRVRNVLWWRTSIPRPWSTGASTRS